MLQPKRQKYRKQQKGRNRGIALKGSTLSFGSYGLKALELGRITNRQLEAARIAMTRETKREGQVWIRIFPDKPITHKPAEVRMGKGKGAVEYYVALVQPGRILFEMEGIEEKAATKALNMAAQKLPIKTKVVARHDL
ncbi:MAG: 50S ribosomal protein L16 [Saprospiraceae bacterium]|jgi:large subunit ribosomal protein L16|nr:50S ribosomal protein L16 [Saprospiraceae bacterium]MBK6480591.1 50S ribosomal protein L16 [Saprospiraceae bacterium]MBK6817048.1 50S ribosomal protein L16 [Saprospiraceae bacterium]MBK7371578.1 50S ribosomal protein L16 [Saprospiraceae bacterium]MBK7435924.1 50S ribosomal protein L16 [Saprospiraceae bacterium]